LSFPFTIVQEFYVPESFYRKKNKNFKGFLDYISKNLPQQDYSEIKYDNTLLSTRTNLSLAGISYGLAMRVSETDFETKIHLESSLYSIIKVLLISIVLLSGISLLSVSVFCWIACSFIAIFYIGNVLVIQQNNKKLMTSLFGKIEYNFEGSERLSVMQKKWMKNVTTCPACGNFVSEIEIYCSECGLRVKQNKYSIPLDITKFKDKNVVYHFRSKKEESEQRKEDTGLFNV
jgi:hypothetical protein